MREKAQVGPFEHNMALNSVNSEVSSVGNCQILSSLTECPQLGLSILEVSNLQVTVYEDETHLRGNVPH